MGERDVGIKLKKLKLIDTYIYMCTLHSHLSESISFVSVSLGKSPVLLLYVLYAAVVLHPAVKFDYF